MTRDVVGSNALFMAGILVHAQVRGQASAGGLWGLKVRADIFQGGAREE